MTRSKTHYLAIPSHAFEELREEPLFQVSFEDNPINLIVFDEREDHRMDRIAKFEAAITEILEDYGAHYAGKDKGVLVEKIVDPTNHHYLLILAGWTENQHIYHCLFHFDIIDGKIWIQKNETDHIIAEELMEKGIANTEIVLGMKPPHIRKFTEFAEA